MAAITHIHDVTNETVQDPSLDGDIMDAEMNNAPPGDTNRGTTPQIMFGRHSYVDKAYVETVAICFYNMAQVVPPSVVTASGSLLAEPVNSSETDLLVDNGTDFEVGDYIVIDDEIMLVTDIPNDEITVTRAQLGTRAWVHADDTAIFILGGAIITAAAWWIYVASNVTKLPGAGTIVFTAYRIKRQDWVESEVTWNDYKDSTAWQTAGALGANDYDSAFASVLTYPTPPINAGFATGWWSPSILRVVQDAQLSRSGQVHFKVWRTDAETENGWIQYHTKERTGADAYQRPHLRVTYTLDGKTYQVRAR